MPMLRLILAAVVFLVPPIFFELVLLSPWPAWFYGAYGAVAGLVMWGLDQRNARGLGGVLAAFALTLAILWLVPWSSRKVFLQDLARVEPGMSRAQVEEILAGYIHGTGWPADPFRTEDEAAPEELEIRDAQVFRHSRDGRFNSDWGVVYFDEGRVTGVEFLYD